MALENLFPPLPSELIRPLAGYARADGRLQLAPTVAAGTWGLVVGALPGLGVRVGGARTHRSHH